MTLGPEKQEKVAIFVKKCADFECFSEFGSEKREEIRKHHGVHGINTFFPLQFFCYLPFTAFYNQKFYRQFIPQLSGFYLFFSFPISFDDL